MKLSIILPVYNDWKCLEQVIEEIYTNDFLNKNNLNLVIIDDCSSEEYSNFVKKIKVPATILFHKFNKGNQESIFTGLRYLEKINSDFDFIIIMDSDGEDDPNDIEKLILNSNNNNKKIVFAKRASRENNLIFKILYNIYKILFYFLVGKKMDFGNFCCIPKEHFKKILVLEKINIHFSASIYKNNKNICFVFCNRKKRYDGQTKTNSLKLIVHGLKSLSIFYEEVISKLIVMSLLVMIFCILMTIPVLYLKLFTPFPTPGWTTVAILGLSMIFLLFFLLFTISIFFFLMKFQEQRGENNNQYEIKKINQID